MIDPQSIKSQFPIFGHHAGLIYFDNAATTQRPEMVINKLQNFYARENANIHRGLYGLSVDTTNNYEKVREKVNDFIGGKKKESIAFTRGTTEAINVVANTYLKPRLKAGENVVISAMEHHSNLIPWQQVCLQNGAELRVLPVNDAGDLKISALDNLLDGKTRMLAVSHISNTIGTVNPIGEIVNIAHGRDVPVLIDAAQSACFYPLDIASLGCEFLAFSGHKLFGPFGVGVLYTRPDLIDNMSPYNFGGGMITHVGFEESSFMAYPHNLEAGTPQIAEVIGLASAIDFLEQINKAEAINHLTGLADYFVAKLKDVRKSTVVCAPKERTGIVSFLLDDIHPHDVATFLAEENIALRAGHHCTKPLLERLGVKATLRVSFSIYNSRNEIDHMINVLKDIQKFWS